MTTGVRGPTSSQPVDLALAAIEQSDPVLAGDSWRRLVFRRLIRSPSAIIGLILIGGMAIISIIAPLLTHNDPIALPTTISLNELNALPSRAHPFGTDYVGRDLFARVLYGGRLSLPAGLGAVLISFSIGVPLGTIAGFLGRVVDDVIMRCMDVLLAFPGIILAIGIVTILGPSLMSTVIAIGIVGIPGYARIARGQTLQARELDYTLAARSTGAGTLHIVFRHITPNIIDPIVVLATLNLGGAILATAALSFIGLGSRPPDPNWGVLLSDGYEHMFQSWAELVFPALAIIVAVLGINLLGDGLADALNPKSRR
jgi:peptide/nickel transport system permease protein